MDSPETRNALSEPAQMQEFVDLCAAVKADRSVKVVVLTGNGPAFCAGGNVKDMRERGGIFAGSPYELRESYRNGIQRIPLALYELDVPVVAAINGPAIGAGLDLACMCDVRISADTAKFAESFVKLGIVPGDGGAWLLPRIVGMPKASLMALTGSYKSVERIAIFIGLFEFAFLGVAFIAHPSIQQIMEQVSHIPIHNSQYLYLAAANIGAVIMPWMIFYQQSAVVDKGLNISHLKICRWDTAIGAVITQLIMAAALVMMAATVGQPHVTHTHPNAPLETVQEISHALVPYLGSVTAKIIFSLGMIGAASIAAIVVSLTAAWGLGEITGYKRSLEHHPKDAPWFYLTYILVLILGGFLVASHWINLVSLSVGVNVMNALLLPIVLGFLFLLSRKALPEKYKLKGVYAWIVGLALFITASFGVYGGISGIFY